MPDTIRTLAALQGLLADNVAGDIGAQDVRDFLVSAWTPEWLRYLHHRLPDETAHALDDFFDDAALDAAWTTLSTSGGQTITEFRDLLSIEITTAQSASDVNAILKEVSPSVGDVIETRVHASQVNDDGGQDYVFGGLVFSDGVVATSNAASVTVHRTSTNSGWGVVGRNGTFTNMSGAPVTNVWRSPTGPVYLRLEYDAVNSFRVFISPDGAVWYDVGTFADVVTPTHVGVLWSTWGEAADGQTIGYDYFRYNAA